MKHIPTLATALVGLAIALPQASFAAGGNTSAASPKKAAAGPVATVCGVLGRYKTKTDDTAPKSTTSTTFVDIPNGVVGFKVTGTSGSCVIVSFSSNAFAPDSSGALLFVQALLDGTTVANPGEVQFAGSDGSFNFAKSFDFVFPSVAPGNHTLKMQFRSFFAGDTVFINKHTIVVQYR